MLFYYKMLQLEYHAFLIILFRNQALSKPYKNFVKIQAFSSFSSTHTNPDYETATVDFSEQADTTKKVFWPVVDAPG